MAELKSEDAEFAAGSASLKQDSNNSEMTDYNEISPTVMNSLETNMPHLNKSDIYIEN